MGAASPVTFFRWRAIVAELWRAGCTPRQIAEWWGTPTAAIEFVIRTFNPEETP